MTLSKQIQRFFDADKKGDAHAVSQAFESDAIVTDERRTYSGREAIQAWWVEAKRKTPHTNEPIEQEISGDLTKVRTRVIGDFDGSPAVLTFAFDVSEDKIRRLEITG